MLSLLESLNNRPYRELRVMAGAHHLPFNNRLPKVRTIDRLYHQLLDCLPRTVKRLSTAEHQALRALQAAGGQMPHFRFVALFGAIPRWRPWNPEESRHPWRYPESVGLSLWQKGFIHAEQWGQVTLIEEAADLLPPLPEPIPAAWRGSLRGQSAVCIDVAVLLGTLLHDDVPLFHGRWLPPYAMKSINQRLPVPDPMVDNARSELQTGRMRFLHYIAQAAGLVAVQNGYLKPTVRAWDWLAKSDEQAWTRLWQAVDADLSSRDSLWEKFRFEPFHRSHWRAFTRAMSLLEPGQAVTVVSLVDILRPYLPELDVIVLLTALAEPLQWLGYWQRTDETIGVMPPPQSTAQNAYLSSGQDGFWVHLPENPRRHGLTQLLAFTTPDADGLRIDKTAVVYALEGGIGGEVMLQILTDLCGLTSPLNPLSAGSEGTSKSVLTENSLPSSVYGGRVGDGGRIAKLDAVFTKFVNQLDEWIDAVSRVQLRHMTVLCADSDTNAQIRADWRLRELLGDTLSPRHVMVDATQSHRLRKKLARRGMAVLDHREKTHTTRERAPQVHPELAEYLWLAVRTYQQLGSKVDQTVRVPGAVTDWLKSQIESHRRDSLNDAVSTVIEQVKSKPPPTYDGSVDPSSDEQHFRKLVLQALESNDTLNILYRTTYGVSQRTIEPLLVYEEFGAVYVEAWCHLDRANRTFRLDRIIEAVLGQGGVRQGA